MDVRLILDEPREGPLNMGLDEALLQTADEAGPDAQPVLRIYSWSAPTLSLGYFQSHRDRQQHLESQGCPWVRRATGGGAILHDRELTYSFVWPAAPRTDPQPIYRLFHESLRRTLQRLGADAQLCSAPRRGAPEPFLCFQRRAAGDLLMGELKVGGSAQRRHRRAALQHGSILWQRSPCAPQLPGIADLHPGLSTAEAFRRRWLETLESEFEMTPSSISSGELDLGVRLGRERFSSPRWQERR